MGQSGARRDRPSSPARVLIKLDNLQAARLRQAISRTSGETGEVYLVGPDSTSRSRARFATGELMTEKMTTARPATRAAAGLSRRSHHQETTSGHDVISRLRADRYHGRPMGIISKIDLPKKPWRRSRPSVLVLASRRWRAFHLAIALLGYASAPRISRPLDQSLAGHGQAQPRRARRRRSKTARAVTETTRDRDHAPAPSAPAWSRPGAVGEPKVTERTGSS